MKKFTVGQIGKLREFAAAHPGQKITVIRRNGDYRWGDRCGRVAARLGTTNSKYHGWPIRTVWAVVRAGR